MRGLKIVLRILAVLLVLVLLVGLAGFLMFRHRSSPNDIIHYETSNSFITGKTQVSAHRAGGGIMPEETMMALKNCTKDVDFSIDVFEFDLHLTKDDVLVLLHDNEMDRTSDSVEVFGREHVRPEEMTFDELRKLNMGAKFVSDSGESPYADLHGEDVPDDLRIVALTEALDYLESIDDSWYRVDRNFNTWNKWDDALSFGYYGVSSYNAAEDGDVGEFFHRLWPEAITKEAGNFSCYSYAKDVDNPQMMALTGIRYVITYGTIGCDWAELLTTTEHGACVYRVKSGGEISPLYLRTTVLSESTADGYELAELRGLLDETLIVDDEATEKLTLDGGKIEQATDLQEAADGSVSGTVESSADALACLAVPNTGDWVVRVDGEEVPTFRANYGFVGFSLSKGRHDVEAYYRPAGLFAGGAASGVGLLLACLGALLARRVGERDDGDAPIIQHAAHMRS